MTSHLTKFTVKLFNYFVSLLCAVGISGEAWATTYYMATSGSDSNTGTISQPWASLTKAHTILQPGDNLYIRGGTYADSNNRDLDWTTSGSAGNPITIRNYTGETPIFDGDQANWFLRIYYSHTVNNLVFDGLEFTDFANNAFRIHWGNYITIKNCKIHDFKTYQTGAIVTGSYDDSSATNIIIENNTFERIGANGTRGPYTNGDHMIYLSKGTSGVTIRNNFFKDCYSGYQIHQYHSPYASNVLIYNNIFIVITGYTKSVLRVEGGTGFEFYNNTININSDLYAIRMGTSGTTLTVKNNIFYGTATYGYIYKTDGTLTADYNLYWPDPVDSDDSGSHSFSAAPLFVYINSDWRLQTKSSAINRGTIISKVENDYFGNKRPQDVTYDIGAHEYVAPPPPPPPPPPPAPPPPTRPGSPVWGP